MKNWKPGNNMMGGKTTKRSRNDPLRGLPLMPEPNEEERRRTLLFMLEDLEEDRRKINQARKDWADAFDAVSTPIFLHDKDFRIVRANRAYLNAAGMDIQDAIGKPYWEVFPKMAGPLPDCTRLTENPEQELTLPAGEIFISRGYVIRDDEGRYTHSIHILEDITERKRAESELKLFRTLLDNSNDYVEVFDPETLRLLDVNVKECHDLGYSREELLSMSVHDIDPNFGTSTMGKLDKQIHETGAALFETFHRRKDGSTFPVEVSAKFVNLGRTYILCIARDISERKEAEAKIRDLALFPSENPSPVLRIGNDGILNYANEASTPLLEKFSMAVGREVPADWTGALSEALHTGRNHEFTLECQGRIYSFIATPITEGGYVNYYGRDITERKHAEEAVLASRDLLRSIVEHIPARVFWKDSESRFLGCNSLFARDAGMTHPEDLLGKDDFQMSWREQAELYQADDKQVMGSDTPKLGYEEPQTTPDGNKIWLRTSKVPLHDTDGKVFGMLGIYEDITEHKQAEEALRRSNRALKTLSACNEKLVYAKTETELLDSICRVIVETGGYTLAWIGFIEHDPEKSIRPVSHYGHEEGFLTNVKYSWGDNEFGQGPTGMAARTGDIRVNQILLDNPAMAPWRTEVLKHSFLSSIALPLKDSESILGVLTIDSPELETFNEAEVKLLGELAQDLAFGINVQRTRRKQRKSQERLRESLVETIRAIALTVEKRDPYTAGHQQRVAGLCVAIGKELGLPEDRIEGLRLGATIHDIGKIYVPAEILNRPGRLSEAEFEIIKSHPQVGYEIIKDVKFPWPVAAMILQHHERLDGSGYPNGLKGDQIILEARILSIADVTEAMSSYRPYRPKLGIDVALKEIETNAGKLYDREVADICLRLFREKGFNFPA